MKHPITFRTPSNQCVTTSIWDSNAPIKFSRKNKGYYYTDLTFSIEIGFGPREYEAVRVLVEFYYLKGAGRLR